MGGTGGLEDIALGESVEAPTSGAQRPTSSEPDIRAIPLRHYGRWVGAAVSILFAVLVIRLFVLSPNINWEAVGDYLFSSAILQGVQLTIILTVVSMAIGLIIGVVIAVMRLSVNPVLGTISWVYVWLFRGTPLLVQIIFWYNIALVLPTVGFGIPTTSWWVGAQTATIVTAEVAAILALGLNTGAYMSEIVRAGIQVVDVGQTEAGMAVGLKKTAVFRLIVLPQAMRAIIPPTGNQFIDLLKSSSLVSVIAARELMTRAQNIYAGNLLTVELLIVAATWYLIVTTVLTWGQFYVERHFARGSSNRELPPTPIQKLREQLNRVFRVGGARS